jgi:hypothetical protein
MPKKSKGSAVLMRCQSGISSRSALDDEMVANLRFQFGTSSLTDALTINPDNHFRSLLAGDFLVGAHFTCARPIAGKPGARKVRPYIACKQAPTARHRTVLQFPSVAQVFSRMNPPKKRKLP